MKLKHLFVRPSDVVRNIENGVLGTGALLRNVAVAAGQDLRAMAHAVRMEYRARKLADANALADQLTREQRDVEEINARLAELMAARKRKAKTAARKRKVA